MRSTLERRYDGPIPEEFLEQRPAPDSPEYGPWLLASLQEGLADSVTEWQRDEFAKLIRQCKEKYNL